MSPSKERERYNPLDGTWSICAHMLSSRENAGCTVYLGQIYVTGGKDELHLELCAAERFDPDTMRWTPVKCMRSKRDNVSNGSHQMLGLPAGFRSGLFLCLNNKTRKDG